MIWVIRILELAITWIPFTWVVGLFKKRIHPIFQFLKVWYEIHPPEIWIKNPAKRFLGATFYQNETEIITDFIKGLNKESYITNKDIFVLIDRIEISSYLIWKNIDSKNKSMSVFLDKLDLRHRTSTRLIIENIQLINGRDLCGSERLEKYLDVFYYAMRTIFYGVPKFMESLNGELQKHLDKLPKNLYTDK